MICKENRPIIAVDQCTERDFRRDSLKMIVNSGIGIFF
ncbi:hypothetical protein HMPREF9012_1496 [Bacteroidetes bacterium oral taxon 272 str. F0290]|nr:hypothetical protein HMPREF9012_1496 [Bacteroidetes bacterium oral taxon 272 str. F0290]